MDTGHISKSSLSCARSFLSKKKFGRAFANFLLFLKLTPNRTDEVLDDFIQCMTEWTTQLITEERIDDLFKCYEQACEILPSCELVLNNIGAQLFSLGYIEESALYIRRAIQINPHYVPAQQNFENVCSHLVERWHFRMLNDVRRNCAYKIAIRRAAQRGHQSVLDIGCGTGILSLFAMKAGMTEIYACEKSRTMCEIANDVFTANKAKNKITIIPKLSTDLSVGIDLPHRVSLLVTETFDAALFGENIVHTLQHAIQNLLLPVDEDNTTGAAVIPCGATVYVCPIECEAIRSRNRFLYSGLNNVDLDEGTIYCTTGSHDDPYTTENLSRIRGGYKALSDPTVLTKVDFTSLEVFLEEPEPFEITHPDKESYIANLNHLYFTELDILSSGIQWNVEVNINKSGMFDAVALWFDLHLDPDISIATDPTNKNCWEQAIYPVLPFNIYHGGHEKGSQTNFHLNSDSIAHLSFILKENFLCLHYCKVKDQDIMDDDGDHLMHSQEPVMGDNPETLLDYHDQLQHSQEPVLLERNEVLKLNNLSMNRLYAQAIEKTVIKGENDSISMVDFTGELSPLPVQFLKHGFSQVAIVTRRELHDKILRIAANNNIDMKRLSVQDSIQNISGEYDILVCDLIEVCGALKQQVMEDIALLRVSCLSDDGVVIPGKLAVHGVCVESDDLLRDSCVINDEVTLGFSVAKYINDFQMSTHVDIDFLELQHRKITAPFELLTFDLNEDLSDQKPPSFLKLTNNVTAVAIETGHVTAVVYWFDIELCPGIHFTTLDSVSHWKQAAVMLNAKEQPVLAGQELNFVVTLENSCLNIKMKT